MLGKSPLRYLEATAGHSSRSLGSVRRSAPGVGMLCPHSCPGSTLCLCLCPESSAAEPSAPALPGLLVASPVPGFSLAGVNFFPDAPRCESHSYQQHRVLRCIPSIFPIGACGLLPPPFTAPCQSHSETDLTLLLGWLHGVTPPGLLQGITGSMTSHVLLFLRPKKYLKDFILPTNLLDSLEVESSPKLEVLFSEF